MNRQQTTTLFLMVASLLTPSSPKPASGSNSNLIQKMKGKAGDKHPALQQGFKTSDPFHKDFNCKAAVHSIVGGKEAYPFSQPWMAYAKPQFPSNPSADIRCGATLISDQWVITAGHCVQYLNERAAYVWITVAVHDVTKAEEEDAIALKVSGDQIFFHEDYVEDDMVNDIALLQLPERIPSDNPHVRPACLARTEKDPTQLTTVIASGWGLVSVTPQIDGSTLQTLEVQIYPCEPVEPQVICARKVYGRPGDTCHGDSGGPMIYRRDGQSLIIGVMSTGSASCSGSLSDLPATYMRVSYYMEWIKKTIQENMRDLKVINHETPGTLRKTKVSHC